MSSQANECIDKKKCEVAVGAGAAMGL